MVPRFLEAVEYHIIADQSGAIHKTGFLEDN